MRKPRRAVEVLSQVCRTWRRLCVETPDLWTTIMLWVPPFPDRNERPAQGGSVQFHTQMGACGSGLEVDDLARRHADAEAWMAKMRRCNIRTRDWIKRARGLPLDVVLEATNPDPGSHPGAVYAFSFPIEQTMKSTSAQWRSVRLELSNVRYTGRRCYIDTLLDVEAPSLKSLHLKLVPWASSISHENLALLSSKSLRHLDLDVEGAFDFKQAPVMWSALTELRIVSRFPRIAFPQGILCTETILYILSHSPNLVSCEFNRCDPRTPLYVDSS